MRVNALSQAQKQAVCLGRISVYNAAISASNRSISAGFVRCASKPESTSRWRSSASPWYPEVLKGMEAVGSAQSAQMKQSPMYQQWYAPVAPYPEQFPQLLDRMGELMRKDYDWRAEIAKLRMPTLLLFADHDAVSMRHIAEFFALFEGGVRDAGWEGTPRFSRARLAIMPGYTHYNFGMGPDVARVIEAYLDQPTSKATQFTP
jgi:pimeloyl-ACP methyl ester carboxylesterase